MLFTEPLGAHVPLATVLTPTQSSCYGFGLIARSGQNKITVLDASKLGYFSNAVTNMAAVDTSITNDAMCFLSATTMVSASFNTTNCRHINLTTEVVTNIGAVDFVRTTNKYQQIAADPVNHRAMFVSFTNGDLGRLDNTPAGSVVTPGGAMAGQANQCIILKDGGTTFIVGTQAGKVIEVSYAGAVISSLTLPSVPNCGTLPTLQITSMAMTGDRLFVGTSTGVIFEYTWSTLTLLRRYFIGAGGSNANGIMLSNIQNGVMLVGIEGTNGGDGVAFSLWDTVPPLMQSDEGYTSLDTHLRGLFLHTDKAIIALGTSELVFMGVVGLIPGTELTRYEDPPGTDVAQRVYRILNPQGYRAKIESDQSLVAGPNNLAMRAQGINYIEIGSNGTPFAGETASIRRFNSDPNVQ